MVIKNPVYIQCMVTNKGSNIAQNCPKYYINVNYTGQYVTLKGPYIGMEITLFPGDGILRAPGLK